MRGVGQVAVAIPFLAHAACVEVDVLAPPPTPAQAASVIVFVRSAGEVATGEAFTREAFETQGLSPIVRASGQALPEIWIEFFERPLLALGLESGPLDLVAEETCGAKRLPEGELRYQLQSGPGGPEFTAVAAGLRPPATHVRGACPCLSEPRFEVVPLPGLCGVELVPRANGRVALTGHLRQDCDDSPLLGRTAKLFDPVTLELTETATVIPHVTAAFSLDGVTTFWGDVAGSLYRATTEGRAEPLFSPPERTGAVQEIVGGLVDGAVELMLVIDPSGAGPDGERQGGAFLYRYREHDGVAELLLGPDPFSVRSRQATVALWIDPSRSIVFPEDDQSWYDLRGSTVNKHLWPPVRPSVRTGALLQDGTALLGALDGHLYELNGTDWVSSARFRVPAPDELRAILSVSAIETWYFAGESLLGREIDGTSCPPRVLETRLRAIEMLAVGDRVVVVGERLDFLGSMLLVAERVAGGL